MRARCSSPWAYDISSHTCVGFDMRTQSVLRCISDISCPAHLTSFTLRRATHSPCAGRRLYPVYLFSIGTVMPDSIQRSIIMYNAFHSFFVQTLAKRSVPH